MGLNFKNGATERGYRFLTVAPFFNTLAPFLEHSPRFSTQNLNACTGCWPFPPSKLIPTLFRCQLPLSNTLPTNTALLPHPICCLNSNFPQFQSHARQILPSQRVTQSPIFTLVCTKTIPSMQAYEKNVTRDEKAGNGHIRNKRQPFRDSPHPDHSLNRSTSVALFSLSPRQHKHLSSTNAACASSLLPASGRTNRKTPPQNGAPLHSPHDSGGFSFHPSIPRALRISPSLA
jgi:hypothetical protein